MAGSIIDRDTSTLDLHALGPALKRVKFEIAHSKYRRQRLQVEGARGIVLTGYPYQPDFGFSGFD